MDNSNDIYKYNGIDQLSSATYKLLIITSLPVFTEHWTDEERYEH